MLIDKKHLKIYRNNDKIQVAECHTLRHILTILPESYDDKLKEVAMRIEKKEFTRQKKRAMILSILVTLILVMVITITSLNYTLKKNVYSRAINESEFLAKQQCELINKTIEEQFHKISTISEMVEEGLSFYDEKNQTILNAFVKQNELSMLAYADRYGDVITYQGEKIENITDREYFTQIMSGEKEYTCQYFERTQAGNEPKVIFATAVYQQEEIQGVIFFSKDVDVIKDNLFQQSMFYNKDSSIITDNSGNILVKNNSANEEYASVKSIYDIYSEFENINTMLNKESGSMILGDNKEMILAYSTIRYNNWHLVCLIDTETAKQEYAENLIAIRQLVLILSICFLGIGVYAFGLVVLHKKYTHNKYKENYERYDRIIMLLKKMKCLILEYDIDTGKIITNELFKDTFGYGINSNFFENIEDHKQSHPEFDFDGLIRELNYAIKTKKTTSFESLFYKNTFSYKILSIIMMPIVNGYGDVVKIIGSIRESSENHIQLKEKVDMIDQIPGGTYRYYLNNPIHLSYIGEKFCEMLGYTAKEFKEKLGDNYIKLILEEDRDIFKNFIKEAATSTGVRKCQYRMYCKNGETLSIIDTMESIKNDSGIMYGYSVVVDISEYTKRRNIIRQEYIEMENTLEILRVQNSTNQMQPHFLYNALSSIREIVLTDPSYASDLIYDFTIYLRACIKTMKDGKLVFFTKEMESIKSYVNIEKMRMSDRLKIIYDIQSEDFLIVPLSIQPLVENAIRHGIYQRGKAGGCVNVRTRTELNYNLIIIEDDGVGFDYQKVRNEVEEGKRDSIGLDNVMFRLKKQLNAQVIIKSKLGSGTKVIVKIPREKVKYEGNNSR